MKPVKALSLVLLEFIRATDLHGPFNSIHEGYAIIEEEFDELWDVVKLKRGCYDNQGRTRREALREEAIQVAAMGLRFLVDCCEDDSK